MGMTVVLIGVAMLVLPGPGLVVIPIGLAILATEYAWARRWLNLMKEGAEKGVDKLGIRNYLPGWLFGKRETRDSDRSSKE